MNLYAFNKIDPAKEVCFIGEHKVAENHTGDDLDSGVPREQSSLNQCSEQCEGNLDGKVDDSTELIMNDFVDEEEDDDRMKDSKQICEHRDMLKIKIN